MHVRIYVGFAPFVVCRVNTVFFTLCLSFVNYFELDKTGEIVTFLSDTIYVPLRKVDFDRKLRERRSHLLFCFSLFVLAVPVRIHIYDGSVCICHGSMRIYGGS